MWIARGHANLHNRGQVSIRLGLIQPGAFVNCGNWVDREASVIHLVALMDWIK